MHENREISSAPWSSDQGRSAKATSRTADMHALEKPDCAVVPVNQPNKGGKPSAEVGEATYGTPTWIWSVVVEDELYVRPYNGSSSRWYKAAMTQSAGRITVAGMTKDVTFELVKGSINDQIDDAYRTKYKSSPYLQPMIGSRARTATVRITPREF
jgi:hypothetical protein